MHSWHWVLLEYFFGECHLQWHKRPIPANSEEKQTPGLLRWNVLLQFCYVSMFTLTFKDNFPRKISSMVARKKTDSDVRYLLQTASCVGAQSMWCRHMMWLISASPNNPTPHIWYIIFYKEHITNLSFDDKPTFDLADSERWKVCRPFHWFKQPNTTNLFLINR